MKITAILKVIETKNYLYLLQTEDAAWIFPKKQIKEEIYNDFVQYLKEKISF